jgi:diadenylate cyclase
VTVREWVEALTWRDFADVVIVAIVIYYLLLLIRGTRAVQVLMGILFLGGVFYLAGLAGLETLQRLLQSFLIVLPFAVIVLFQQEIRRALANVGRNPLLGFNTHQKTETTIQEVVLAASTLASREIGALIVVQRLEGLREYIENGVPLDAEISYHLLLNIFDPHTPLHDGAVIVQGDRIAAAACFLPLTVRTELAHELGTRHRAALTVSEETDALALVVSEETGIISLAVGGELIRELDAKSLRNYLFQYLVKDVTAPLGRPS